MTREEHISNLETIGCDGWTVTTEAYKSLQFAIEALEQEPCEDCISRQAVLDLCDTQDRYEIPYEYSDGGKHIKGYDEGRIINVTKLKMLPSVTPKPKTEWIPVSERLPENSDYVLATDGLDIFVAWHNPEKVKGWHSFDGNFDMQTPIVGWQPLPKPYKAERSDKE